jgi:hypothetical protein
MGELKGTQIQPREIVEACYALGWVDALDLVTMVATILSESQGYDRAYNDNVSRLGSAQINATVRNAETGEPVVVVSKSGEWVLIRHEDGTQENYPVEAQVVTSRDIGLCQINTPAAKIGTDEEERLYDWHYNLVRARALYDTKTNTAGAIRGFTPWYGYTNEVYLRDSYIKRAARGVGNFVAEMLLERTPTDTLNDGQPYVHSLATPVLDYRYRVADLNHAMDVVVARARQLKPLGGAAVDAKADEIIHVALAAKAAAKT